MLKVAIVGCGKIADSHASQILRIKGCEIVGVCDNEPLMARQLFQRFPIKRHFAGLSELLDEAKPDVVHITTPPHSHFDLAKTCLERGATFTSRNRSQFGKTRHTSSWRSRPRRA